MKKSKPKPCVAAVYVDFFYLKITIVSLVWVFFVFVPTKVSTLGRWDT